MAGQLALPFKSSGISVDSLTKISLDERASMVAIHHEEKLVSINYLDLLPGDVVLFDGGKFDPLFANPIQRYQNAVFDDKKIAKWKHVGILDANYQVWDAMPELDVRVRPLREILRPVCRVCVRRPRVTIDKDRLLDSLMRLSSSEYRMFDIDTGGALLARLMSRLQRGSARVRMKPEKVICSMFVSNVLRLSTGHSFFRNLPIVIPADYLVDDDFLDVDLDWCCLEKSGPVALHSETVQPSA